MRSLTSLVHESCLTVVALTLAVAACSTLSTQEDGEVATPVRRAPGPASKSASAVARMPDAAHAASAATKEFLHGPLVAYSKFGFFVIDGRSGKPLCAQQISATMASGRKLELMLNDRSACSYYTWDGEPGTVTIVVKHPGYSPATRSVLLEYDDGCWLRGKPTDFTIDLTPAGAGGP